MAPTSRSTRWVAEDFDRRAARYDESEMHAWQALRAAQLLDVQPGQWILDIASGTGLATRAAVEQADGLTVVGVDVSRRMLEIAREVST
jgi:ubiquinone/menaquinone biosynthesis C-methylase UbiE